MNKIILLLKAKIFGIQVWLFLVIIVVFILIIALLLKLKKRGIIEVENVRIRDGKRYTRHSEVEDKEKKVVISYLDKDIILKRGVSYVVKKGGEIIPGKYSILSSIENIDKFNVRLGGFVKEIEHNSALVLEEGDEICSVSHTTILR